jgi:hypothetical protein
MSNEQSLEEKILPGYWYRNTYISEEDRTLDEKVMNFQAGYKGIAMYIKAFRKLGFSDEVIATEIEVEIEENVWIPLSNVIVINKTKND